MVGAYLLIAAGWYIIARPHDLFERNVSTDLLRRLTRLSALVFALILIGMQFYPDVSMDFGVHLFQWFVWTMAWILFYVLSVRYGTYLQSALPGKKPRFSAHTCTWAMILTGASYFIISIYNISRYWSMSESAFDLTATLIRYASAIAIFLIQLRTSYMIAIHIKRITRLAHTAKSDNGSAE